MKLLDGRCNVILAMFAIRQAYNPPHGSDGLAKAA
jgi:hypothetical protein